MKKKKKKLKLNSNLKDSKSFFSFFTETIVFFFNLREYKKINCAEMSR